MPLLAGWESGTMPSLAANGLHHVPHTQPEKHQHSWTAGLYLTATLHLWCTPLLRNSQANTERCSQAQRP
jgi:hypothetical protein